MYRKSRVFICHFHSECRNQLRFLLSHIQNAVKIVGECSEFPDCVEWLENNDTDQVIIAFPRFLINSDEILEQMQNWFPHVEFIEFSLDEIDRVIEFYVTGDPVGNEEQLLQCEADGKFNLSE